MEASGERWGRGRRAYDIHASKKAIVDNPAWRLVQAIGTFVADDGNTIVVDGFHDNVRPPTPAEEAAVAALKQDYDRPGGLQVVEVAGGYQITTKPEFHEWVRRLFHERTTQKLSVAALETLAVIAYRQPVTVPEIGDIRGVNASGVIGTLVDRKLIKIVGRKAVVGRPFMYGTTREFLERFGLNDITDLPKVEDMSELLGFDLPAGVGEPAPQSALPFGDEGSMIDGAAADSPADAPADIEPS